MSSRYPTAAELAVLVALKEYHYLTVDQVMLVTGRTSLRATQQRLKDLADAGLVAKHHRRSSNVLKPLRAAWSLTGKSKAYLEEADMVVLPPRRPKPYTLDHTLTINDVLILSRVLERTFRTNIRIRETYHERELRAWGPPLAVVPDGFIYFVVTADDGWHSFPVLLEIDMGTMDRRRWMEKVSRYVSFFNRGLPEAFHTDVATVAVVVNDAEKRVDDLRRWTEQQLTRQKAADCGELFYFAQLREGITAADFFLMPRFQVAFAKETEALLICTLSQADYSSSS